MFQVATLMGTYCTATRFASYPHCVHLSTALLSRSSSLGSDRRSGALSSRLRNPPGSGAIFEKPLGRLDVTFALRPRRSTDDTLNRMDWPSATRANAPTSRCIHSASSIAISPAEASIHTIDLRSLLDRSNCAYGSKTLLVPRMYSSLRRCGILLRTWYCVVAGRLEVLRENLHKGLPGVRPRPACVRPTSGEDTSCVHRRP